MVKYYVLNVNYGTDTEPGYCSVAVPAKKKEALWPRTGRVEDEIPCETREEAKWRTDLLNALFKHYGVHYLCGEDAPWF